MTQLYAYVKDGVVSATDITEEHIANRGHTVDWYYKQYNSAVPTFGITELVVPKFVIDEGARTVTRVYELMPKDVGALIDDLWISTEDHSRLENIDFNALPAAVQKALENGIYAVAEQRIEALAATAGYTTTSAITYIGSHVAKYDREGRVIKYLRDESYHQVETLFAGLRDGTEKFPATLMTVVGRLPTATWDIVLASDAVAEETKATTTSKKKAS